eukprot:GHVS01021791.1.p1 GENE.GHVS01021791.1~~GHVS01021791.1.p1  ORF type:complete len:257 (+),score=33.92 GHVS01021791.1:442-1212(+)
MTSSRQCLNCGRLGHLPEDCPRGATNPAEATDGSTRCFRCGGQDHVTEECRKPNRCDKCGMLGHRMSDCRVIVCGRCGDHGHEERRCRMDPNACCSKCGGRGHLASACLANFVCRWCGEAGHRPLQCPSYQARKTRSFVSRMDQRKKDTEAFYLEKSNKLVARSADSSSSQRTRFCSPTMPSQLPTVSVVRRRGAAMERTEPRQRMEDEMELLAEKTARQNRLCSIGVIDKPYDGDSPAEAACSPRSSKRAKPNTS